MAVIAFYFTTEVSRKPFLWKWSHEGSYESAQNIKAKKVEKPETIDKNLPFLNFVNTQIYDETILKFIIYFMQKRC